jgi:hypothetical protein
MLESGLVKGPSSDQKTTKILCSMTPSPPLNLNQSSGNSQISGERDNLMPDGSFSSDPMRNSIDPNTHPSSSVLKKSIASLKNARRKGQKNGNEKNTSFGKNQCITSGVNPQQHL